MLRAGLIGLPSAGKTTLFQLLTSAREAPRTHGKTEANVGVSRVPDDRLDRLTALFKPEKRVPATVEFADMAAGRGDAKSLLDVSAYRNADALLHVVRAFRDPSVPHPSQSVDPARDVRTIEEELILADLGVVERRLERLEKDLKKQAIPDLAREREVLVQCRARSRTAVHFARSDCRATTRIGCEGFSSCRRSRSCSFSMSTSRTSRSLKMRRASPASRTRGDSGARVTAVCAKIELEIAALEPADAQAFLADLGLKQSGLDRIIRAAYDLLGYISFFTVGEDECRAWSIPRVTPAVLAAGAIHSDIQRGFIRAEVVACDRLLERGSLAACRDHGELRLEGKDYPVADGDVITFRHAT